MPVNAAPVRTVRSDPVWLTVAFGVVALTLAAVGVYGVIALLVSERTSEVGVRLALGASPAQVWSMLVRQAATLGARRSLMQLQLQRQQAALGLIQALGGGWQAPWAQAAR